MKIVDKLENWSDKHIMQLFFIAGFCLPLGLFTHYTLVHGLETVKQQGIQLTYQLIGEFFGC